MLVGDRTEMQNQDGLSSVRLRGLGVCELHLGEEAQGVHLGECGVAVEHEALGRFRTPHELLARGQGR